MTVLLLAIVLAILGTMPVVGSVAEVVIDQHRLNNLADFVALAGAQELEFAPESACAAAGNFAQSQGEAEIYCEVEDSQIYVRLLLPVANSAIRRAIPNLVATSRAGISTEVTH